MADQSLDCKGMSCPLPIIKMSKAIKKMEKGQVLEVLATDPAFKPDVEAWAKRLKHIIVEFDEGPPLRVLVQKNR